MGTCAKSIQRRQSREACNWSTQAHLNFGIQAIVDGGATTIIGAIEIDTSQPGTHTIEYVAVDQDPITLQEYTETAHENKCGNEMLQCLRRQLNNQIAQKSSKNPIFN